MLGNSCWIAAASLLILGGPLTHVPALAQESEAGPRVDAVLLDAPAGDTLAVLRPGAGSTVLEEAGGWARVRVEGWTQVDSVSGVAMGAPGAIGLAAIRSNPVAYEGRTVRWRVQYVALQRADHLRSDMEPGSHYLLARDPGGEPGFVYVLVPEGRLAAIENLAPLQRIEILALVRTGSSPLTGHPILELVEIRTLQER